MNEEFRLEAFDLGILSHEVLKFFFLRTRGQPWAQMDLETAEKLIDAAA